MGGRRTVDSGGGRRVNRNGVRCRGLYAVFGTVATGSGHGRRNAARRPPSAATAFRSFSLDAVVVHYDVRWWRRGRVRRWTVFRRLETVFRVFVARRLCADHGVPAPVAVVPAAVAVRRRQGTRRQPLAVLFLHVVVDFQHTVRRRVHVDSATATVTTAAAVVDDLKDSRLGGTTGTGVSGGGADGGRVFYRGAVVVSVTAGTINRNIDKL